MIFWMFRMHQQSHKCGAGLATYWHGFVQYGQNEPSHTYCKLQTTVGSVHLYCNRMFFAAFIWRRYLVFLSGWGRNFHSSLPLSTTKRSLENLRLILERKMTDSQRENALNHAFDPHNTIKGNRIHCKILKGSIVTVHRMNVYL